ncbi:MAG: F0F1 ATP synthase subunit alpha, partial [Candidatus Paceibacterota bacterium]
TNKQVVLLYALTRGYMDDIPLDKIKDFEERLLEYTERNAKAFYKDLSEKQMWADASESALKQAIEDFKKIF